MPESPPAPRPAATVVLLRDAPADGGLQIFLQRRVAGMAFAGGMAVFPGGGVDAGDRPDPTLWRGPDPAWWAQRFGCPAEVAGALVAAAVRETFEECGVLLAGPGGGGAVGVGEVGVGEVGVGEVGVGDVEETARDDLVARRRTLPDVLAAAGLPLRADLLAPWSRWVTPEAEPRRYDAAFFVARLPDGQEADARTTEAVEATWWHLDAALEAGQRGDLRLMPPTRHTLEEIAEYPDAAAVLAAARSRPVRTYLPVLSRESDRIVVTVPGSPELRFDLGPAAEDLGERPGREGVRTAFPKTV